MRGELVDGLDFDCKVGQVRLHRLYPALYLLLQFYRVYELGHTPIYWYTNGLGESVEEEKEVGDLQD